MAKGKAPKHESVEPGAESASASAPLKQMAVIKAGDTLVVQPNFVIDAGATLQIRIESGVQTFNIADASDTAK